MKEVLISIKPKWCELIANGEKTIEVTKARPNIDTPFKCYIYCTNSKPLIGVYKNKLLQLEEDDFDFYNKDVLYKSNGKVIGEFVCDDVSKFTAEFTDDNCYEDIRYHYFDAEQEEQEMIVVSNELENYNDCWIFRRSCVSFDDLKKYIGINFHDIPFYFWHISDIKIYDKPKDLNDFGIKRPPKPWCYVEKTEE